MRQSPETGRFPTPFVVLSLTFIFWLTGCAHIPRGKTPEATRVEAAATSATKPAAINLNTATATELERLPGVGSVLAERIITYREENGRFRRAEHLMMVRGMSDRKFRELRSRVTVD